MLYMNSSNELQRNQSGLNLYVAITGDERAEARKIAKSKGMTLQGWLALLIKKEIATNSNQEANR